MPKRRSSKKRNYSRKKKYNTGSRARARGRTKTRKEIRSRRRRRTIKRGGSGKKWYPPQRSGVVILDRKRLNAMRVEEGLDLGWSPPQRSEVVDVDWNRLDELRVAEGLLPRRPSEIDGALEAVLAIVEEAGLCIKRKEWDGALRLLEVAEKLRAEYEFGDSPAIDAAKEAVEWALSPEDAASTTKIRLQKQFELGRAKDQGEQEEEEEEGEEERRASEKGAESGVLIWS